MTIPVNRAILANRQTEARSTKIDYFPEKMGSHGMLLVFNRYEFIRPGDRPLLKFDARVESSIKQSNGAILLPLPNTLTDSTGLMLRTENLVDTLGAETAARAAANMSDQGIIDAMGQGLKDLFASATGQTDVTPRDAMYIAKRLFGDNFLLGPAGQGTGLTLNPKSSLVFQGVNLKEFQFDWELAPSEEKESLAIRNIIRKLKMNSLPTYNPESSFTISMLRYPSTVDIYMLGVDPGYFFYFKTAMINHISTNFTPHGLSIVRGGRPASVGLSISLREMDIHTANDYGLTDSALKEFEADREFTQEVNERISAVTNELTSMDNWLNAITANAALYTVYRLLTKKPF